jgi:hypothetical protein
MDDFTAWLRQRIQARMALACGTIELGNAEVWHEQSSGVLMTGDGTDEDHWHGMWAMGDSTLTRLMEANDPRDTIARCEAELAILDAHYILTKEDRSEQYEEFSVTPHPGADGCDFGCVTCHYRGMGGVWGQGYCRTVRLLGYAYRHRDGYRPEWAPIAMTAQSLGKLAFGGAGMSASGMVSSPHFGHTRDHRCARNRQGWHHRPSFVPANSRNCADPTRPASPPTCR